MYMAVSSGMAMEVHYCMGKESGKEFFAADSKKCSKCGMKNRKGCCHDEHKFYKLGTDHKTVSSDISFGIPDQVIVIPHFSYDQFLQQSFATAKPANNSPPHYSQPDLCIRNCTFRI
jgi:hypothetical protein